MTKNRWISDLHWRRRGQQSRSAKTQDAILDATEALLLERGADGVSVADIAEAAGCSIGSVYHHFKDKTAIHYALFHRMTGTFSAIAKDGVNPSRWEGASIRDILRGFLEFSLLSKEESPSFKKAAMLVASKHPELRTHYAEIQADMFCGMQRLIMARRSEIGHPNPPRSVAFALDQLGAIVHARLDETQRQTLLSKTSDKVFVEDALSATAAILQLKA